MKKNTKKELNYTAKLVIYGLPKFNKNGVKRHIKWLRSIADELEVTERKAYVKNPVFRLMK